MKSTIEEFLLSISAGLLATFFSGPYFGALVIAFVASFTRTAFENQCGVSHSVCFVRWMRFLIMAIGISFIMVSVAAWMKIPTHPAIVMAGFFACFAEETLILLKKSHGAILSKLIKETGK